LKVPKVQTKAIDLFDLDGPTSSDLTVMDLISQELHDLPDCMNMWNIPATWRDTRRVYEMQLPDDGEWLIDADHSATISSLRKAFSLDRLDLSDLKGSDRNLTTDLAGWLWDQTLFDGSLPVGIKYASKFGLDHTCFAIWLRAIDDGKDQLSERVRHVHDDTIEKLDPDLIQAAEALGLWPH
jgi:hypothetical protein